MIACKNCSKDHDGSYASGLFCCESCSRSFSAKSNKDKFKKSKCIKCDTEVIISINASHKITKCDQCKIEEHICSYGCGNKAKYKTTTGYCCEPNFSKCPEIRAKNSKGVKLSYENGKRVWKFTNEHREKSKQTIRDNIKKSGICASKKTLLDIFQVKYECGECGLSTWNDKPIVLEMDHIDGDNKNNLLENLRLLCPNCHSQTMSFRGRNINIGKIKVSDDELIEFINSSSNIRQALIKSNLTPKGGNYDRVKRLILSGKANFKNYYESVV